MISFTLVDNDLIVDEIPLAEVDGIYDMLESAHSADKSVLSLEELERAHRFKFALEIVTAKTGHNSGRTYFLQVSPLPTRWQPPRAAATGTAVIRAAPLTRKV